MSIKRFFIIGLVAFLLLAGTAGNTGYVAAQVADGEPLAGHFGETWTGTSATSGLTVDNRTGTGNGMVGINNRAAWDYAGVKGVNMAAGPGVFGVSYGAGTGVTGISTGNGVYGKGAFGVVGESTSANKAGVYGKNTATNGFGVQGVTTGSGGTAVYGSATGSGTGVLGGATAGVGVMGSSADNFGVWGGTNDPDQSGVFGLNGGTGPGVGALSGGRGVNALSTQDDGVVGETYADYKSGVYGFTTANYGYGVTGHSSYYHGVLAWGLNADWLDGVSDLLLQGGYSEIMGEGPIDLQTNDTSVFVDLDMDNTSATDCFQ